MLVLPDATNTGNGDWQGLGGMSKFSEEAYATGYIGW